MKIFKSVKFLSNILSDKKKCKILLITGSESYDNLNILFKIENYFKNFQSIRYIVDTPNPEYNKIKKGISFFRNYNPDIVIAIGGGSVIDTAKLIITIPLKNSKLIFTKKNYYNTQRPLFIIIK